MVKFVSFNGDAIWWNTDVFDKIGIGRHKWGFIDGDEYDWNKRYYEHEAPRDIMGVRQSMPIFRPDEMVKEKIILHTGKTQEACEKVMAEYNKIKELGPTPEKLWLEMENDSYDPTLFYKIYIKRQIEYDGHNRIEYTDYHVIGKYIDPNNSEYLKEEDKYDEWWGGALLFASDYYGDSEKAIEKSPHFFTIET